MLRLLTLVVLLAFTQISFAQIGATTESGNKVLLFENGTWQYAEKTMAKNVRETQVAAMPAMASFVEIDSTREITSDYQELFYVPSPILSRFFGEIKGRIRCKMSCSNNRGAVQLNYMWEMPVGDGVRYFGYLKAGSKVRLHLQDGQKVELVVAENSTIKATEKYNMTAMSGSTLALTKDQIVALTAQPFRKMEVDWKKKSEVYEVELSRYLMDTLPTVL